MSIASLLKNDEAVEGEFEAYVCDDETTQALVPVMNERDWKTTLIKKGGIENAIRTLSTATSPKFLFVDLSKSTSPIRRFNSSLLLRPAEYMSINMAWCFMLPVLLKMVTISCWLNISGNFFSLIGLSRWYTFLSCIITFS